MKRAISAFLLLAFLTSLSGCGGGIDASDKAVSVGKQAVETVDKYLDGEITYKAASDKVDDLFHSMEYAYDDEEHNGDDTIHTDLLSLSHELLMDKIDQTSSSYDELIEARNTLAKDVGSKKR